MRPKTIIYFEWIIFATLMLGFVQTYLGWKELVAVSGSTASLKLTQLFTVAVIVTLTLLVSRRRSKVAMWLSIVMFALGLPMVFWVYANGPIIGSPLISGTQIAAQFVAYSLLFTASARRWMNDKNDRQMGQRLSPE